MREIPAARAAPRWAARVAELRDQYQHLLFLSHQQRDRRHGWHGWHGWRRCFRRRQWWGWWSGGRCTRRRDLQHGPKLGLFGCTFDGNATVGGLGGTNGLAGTNTSGSSAFPGQGGAGGLAAGGAIYTSNSCVTIVDSCTFEFNFCQSGNSQSGGPPNGSGDGATGPAGPFAGGGGLFNLGTNTFINCTFDEKLRRGRFRWQWRHGWLLPASAARAVQEATLLVAVSITPMERWRASRIARWPAANVLAARTASAVRVSLQRGQQRCERRQLWREHRQREYWHIVVVGFDPRLSDQRLKRFRPDRRREFQHPVPIRPAASTCRAVSRTPTHHWARSPRTAGRP